MNPLLPKMPPISSSSNGAGGAVYSMLATQICRSNPSVTLAFVVDGQGNVRPAERADPRLLKAAVAMVVPFRELAERTAAELGCRGLRCLLLEGEAGTVALADVDGERTAVVVGASDSAPGALRADAMWLAQSLQDDA